MIMLERQGMNYGLDGLTKGYINRWNTVSDLSYSHNNASLYTDVAKRHIYTNPQFMPNRS